MNPMVFLKAHKGVLVPAAIGAGVVTTGILAWRGGLKAEHMLAQLPEGASRTEKLRATWTAWVPPLASMIATISGVCLAHRSYASGIASVSALAAESANKLADFQDEVKTRVKEPERLIENVNEGRRPAPPKGKLPVLGEGGQLIYDSLSGRYFVSDMETVRAALNDFNQSLIGGVFATVNEWYSYLNLPPVTLGGDLGWTSDRLVDILFNSMVDNGQAVLVLDYMTLPTTER